MTATLASALGAIGGLLAGVLAAVLLAGPPDTPPECRVAVVAAERIVGEPARVLGRGLLTRTGPLADYQAASATCLATP